MQEFTTKRNYQLARCYLIFQGKVQKVDSAVTLPHHVPILTSSRKLIRKVKSETNTYSDQDQFS